MTDVETSRWADLFQRRYAAPLITLSLGVGLHALNGFLVSTLLPSLVVDVGGVELMSWSFTVYLVMAIVGGSGAARLKRRMGARMALVLPALVFLAGTLIAAGAESMPMVLVGRALQGIGEGIISALCYALIPELFPSRLVAKVFGVEAMVWAIAAFGGPALSGMITEAISWRAAFLVNVPLVFLFLGLVAIVVPAGIRTSDGSGFPLGRLTALGFGIMLVAVAAILGDPLRAAVTIAVSAAVLVAVFAVDRRRADRLFASDAFTLTTTLGLGLWIVLLMPVVQAAASVYLNITIQHLWGYRPTVAGYIHAIMALSWSGMAVVVANVDDPDRRSALIRLGPILLVLGMTGIALAVSFGVFWAVLPCQVAIGGGFGISSTFISQRVMEAAPPGERDRASAMLPTVQSAGFAIGAALAGLVANTAGMREVLGTAAVAYPARWAFSVAAALGLLSVLAAFRMAPFGRRSRPGGGVPSPSSGR